MGILGKPDNEHADLIHDRFFIQCKRRAMLSIQDWFDTNSKMAMLAGKIPVLIMREDRGEPLAVFRLTDVVDMFRAESIDDTLL